MVSVIIHQRAKSFPGGSFVLTTSTVDAETGEILVQDTIARLTFAWETAVEKACDDAVRNAEKTGAKVVQIYRGDLSE